MKNNYLLLIGCLWGGLLASNTALAQTNFQPGYVLPLTGDTLRGEIDVRDGRANAMRCRFRANPQATITTYAPAEVKAYGLSDGTNGYRSLVVTNGNAPKQASFLEVLVDGPAVLYFLRDAQQFEHYYVVSPVLALAELEHSKTRVVRDGGVYAQEDNAYRTVLATALTNCPAVQSQLPTLVFQESALRRVVVQYNKCQGYQSAAPAAVTESRVHFGVMAGMVQHNLSYTGFPFGTSTQTSRTTGFAVGPVVRLATGRLSQKVSLVLALLYEPEKHELVSTNLYNGAIAGVVTRSYFNMTYLRLPVQFRYTYPRGRIAPVAEVGFTLAYAFRSDNSFEQATASGYYQRPQALLVGEQFRAFQLGVGGGLGLTTRPTDGRAIALLARIEASNGFSGVSGIGASVLHLYALLSIDLTK